ncbi:MAG: hypothetical protein RJA44_2437 [Pseudomonadota bacterium]|jgi:selenide,water dikinase
MPRALVRDCPLSPENSIMNLETPALTQLAHGGGCGCKIAPGVLSDILARSAPGLLPPELMVGIETSDDAAVWRLNDTQALVATTDFFTPIVDDPFDFGRIAATNALSDVYAMGGRPIMALAIVGMPVNKLAPEVIGRILDGGASVCRDAGIPIAGGHSIDVVEPIYGLVALGLVHPDKVRRNADARDGDALVLGKPLGVGVLSAALKKGLLDAAGYAEMLRHTTQLNRVGADLADIEGVHAITDVTGFGLAGHLLEISRGSGLAAEVEFKRLPLIESAVAHAQQGIWTGASVRNWAGYGAQVQWPEERPEWQRMLLTDPQTSGGLLVSCSPAALPQVLETFVAAGFASASPIGALHSGTPGVTVL